ncbi:hypothetical protein [uncultured Clostridium sp.]|uniref:TIGR03943 family putative permease subunit n=1 Tax=uncultured Clostridium sp. TaxID=59620 RepID=UPI002637094B|nr:hypothetical protein [uncultured Clostridium sp.]
MKRFNLDQFIWFLILMFLSVILTFMLFTGKMFALIDSGRIISTSIMMIILYLLTIVQVSRIFTIPSRNGVKGGYFQYILLIFVLGVIMVIDIPKVSLEMKGVRLYHMDHAEGDGHTHKHGVLGDGDTIYINEENFHDGIEELSAHIDKYIGKKIEIEGRYYKDERYKDDFIITALSMNCCIADSEYLGVLANYNKESGIKIENGSKIKIIGEISSFNKDDRTLVKIDVLNLIQYQD